MIKNDCIDCPYYFDEIGQCMYGEPFVSDYVYTNTYYGSCSGCDTLQGIHQYEYGLPDEEQVRDYMQLCLGLLQSCVYMLDGLENKNEEKVN